MQLFPGRNAYLLVLIVAAVDAIWLAFSSVSLAGSEFVLLSVQVAILLVLSWAIERRSFSAPVMERLSGRLVHFMQGIAFLLVAWVALRVLNQASMSFDLPLTDKMLIHWDSFLPIDWHSYFRFVQLNGGVQTVLDYSYTSLSAVSFIGLVLFVWKNEMKRARYFMETFMIAAVVCTAIGVFLPAKGSVATYFGDVSSIAHFKTVPGVYAIDALNQMRSGLPHTLRIGEMPGLTVFPSFHTAAGIVLAVSFWRTSLFPAVFVYTVVMIAATPVFGAHYFIDLIAGAVVAVAICAAFAFMPFYKGMFARRDAREDWEPSCEGAVSF
ncbi:membrane-associated phospholipid phosphatase [Parvibaculum indicum]|uniref:phosphatase PAP2 family protein n=1 Tax=Parvibaculum indicum TaxID=562969 RepID=UPI001421F7FC|nr:phosphatase PAP2 family protein [Parvibaculum indicum]NIJ42720.1 membrane-associated phospholipid phosphatase [Parvibaculum indicum]